MVKCPFCSFQAVDQKALATHFRHQSSTHPDYKGWAEDQRWAGKVEGEDYVRCLECGHRAASLALHLKASHRVTAETYRSKHGDVPVRPTKVVAARSEALRNRQGGFGKGEKKLVTCPECGESWGASKFLVPGVHDSRCPVCREAAQAKKVRPPRKPSLLRGGLLSKETRQKMSENAGRWNAGLTKETSPSMARVSEKMRGRSSWSKGLTADTDSRLAETARKLKFYTGENRPWDNGLAANLTLKDFEPFMDSEGRVDHRKVMEATGISWVTVRRYIVDLGLRETRKYIEDAADDRTIRIEKEVLEGFRLGNGKVSVGKAMSVLKHTYPTIKRECDRHGLPTFHRHISQTICLDAIAAALGGAVYEVEWKSWRFTDPLTGHRFRFDGYFPDIGLVVEFQGHQHYTFPNAYMVKESYLPVYEALRERDRVKRELINAASDLTYFEVLEDEPYADVMYLRGRLSQMGILSR